MSEGAGGSTTLESLPYSNGQGTQTANVTLGNTFVVAQFKLASTAGSFTVASLNAVDQTGLVVPYFAGLANGVTITPSQPFSFSLTSPLTRGAQVDLKYVFMIVETGATFTYSVKLTTN